MGIKSRPAGSPRLSAANQIARLGAANDRLQEDIARRLNLPEKSEVERVLIRALIDQSPDYFFIKDTEGRFVVANRSVTRDTGLPDITGKTDFDIAPAEIAEGFVAVDREILRTGEPRIGLDEAVITGGVKKYLSTTKMPLRNEDGEIIGVVGVSRDITERKHAEFLLTEQNRILEMIAANRPLAEILESLIHMIESQLPGVLGSLLLLDGEGRLRHAAAPNLPQSYSRRIDGVAIGPMVGSCGTAAWRREPVEVADVFNDPLWADYCHLVAPLGLRSCWSTPILAHDGAVLGTFAMYGRQARKPTPAETGLVEVATRIAGIAIERRKAEDRIRHMAHHDPLTGLANYALLMERLGQSLLYAGRDGEEVAVLSIDLDHFRAVNDSFGPEVGDKVLKIVAGRLAANVRATDTVARSAGDGYTVVLYERTIDPTAIAALARLLQEKISAPMIIDGHSVRVTCSIGLASFPADGADINVLLRNVEAALHRAKELGRNNFQFCTARLSAQYLEKIALQEGLRNALAREEFHLVYQPQVDLRSGRIFAVEALIRWRHPERGLIPPDKFIPVAEESGQIVAIGDWVLRAACRQNVAWQAEGLPAIGVSVNVSARQFMEKGWVSRVGEALRETGLAAQHLELELTESLIMQDVQQAIATMREFQAMGVQLSIDDFGTGYSSLNVLKTFPVARLKLDQSFVRELPLNRDDRAITRAIISLGHQLRLKVIAEGVETKDQLDFLRLHDCDEFQGYYFSKPVPAQDFPALLESPPLK